MYHDKEDSSGELPPEPASLHDIRNKLSALLGSLDLLTRRGADDVAKKLAQNSLNVAQEIQTFIESRALVGPRPEFAAPAKDTGQNWQHPAVNISSLRHDLFFSAVEMTRMPMVVTDPHQDDNPIIFVNNAFIQSSGYSREEILGRNCRFLQGPESDPETINTIRNAIKNRTNTAVEIRNYRKDGTMFWNALFISPIFDENGELLYFFGSQLDITRRREAEMALRKAQKMEAIGQLTGGIAHDFNNLLQVMIGNLQLSLQFLEEGSRSERYINIVSGAAERARSLTQQLLAFSRKQALDISIANFNRIITELEEILERTLSPETVLIKDLADDLQNTQIDTIQLEMVLINILVNARDALGASGGTVTIATRNHHVSASEAAANPELHEGLYSVIKITDTGVGMPPEVLSQVTEPFFTTKDVGKGTGLGLSQVYGFVKQSQGYMTIESKVGKGTTVTLMFPATQKESRISIQAEEENEEANGETILIVEDSVEILDLAEEILSSKGYKILRASTAQQALDVLKSHPDIEMVFTDIVMPGAMNGISLAHEVKRLYPKTSILITTGFAEDVHGRPRQSDYEIIYKPYMPQELVRKVHGVLFRRYGHRS